MFNLLFLILKRKKNIFALVMGSLILFIVLRVIPQAHIIYDFWLLHGVNLSRKFEIFYSYSFGAFSSWSWFDTITSIILSFATMINIIVLLTYFKRQQKVLNKGSLAATSVGMVLGMFGVGCVSCGALVIAPILSYLGLLGALELLPFAGRELVIVGLFLVVISTVYLLKKLNQPLVC